LTTNTDELLTVHEVAEHVKLSPDRVRQLIREGVIPSTRLGEGGHLRVHSADLEELLKCQAQWMPAS
jgi:excisionase family DNA binding protein